jgi:phage portal protein BeeE
VSTANVLRVSDAYACVRVLADGISTLPLHVYRRTEQGRVPARDNARAVQLLSKPAPVEPNATHLLTRRGHDAEPSWLRNRPQ